MTFLLVGQTFFSQTNKTFKDIVFKVGDIIKMPEIIWVLDGNGHENDDSLKCISSFINAHQNIVFEIGAHVDTRGSATSNHTLTVARANSIKDALISNFNVQSAQVKTMGYGCSRPFIADSTIRTVKSFQDKESLHSKNRRTELKVLEIK